MKTEHILYCIFTLMLQGFASLCCRAQNPLNTPTTLEGWADRLDVQSQLLPQEITFVHMDNSCYFQGDTVFYKAYVVRSDNGKLSDLSRVLYTELLDNDGYLIERQILKLEDGQAHGSFCLSDTLYCGYYELRAYTRWQLNWGVYEHEHSDRTKYWFFNRKMEEEYFRDYDKLYSRVFPVYKKPSEPGDYAHDMALRPLRRYYRTREEKPQAEIAFFPEGGSWIAGVEQRIAFEANSDEGEHLDGTLVVRNRQGEEVARARTEHRGRGVLTLKGQAEEKYKAEFTWGQGYKSEAKLPKAEADGVVLQVEQRDEALCLHIETEGTAASDSLGLTILSGGILRHHQAITQSDIELPLSMLPNGIAQVTVYDRQGRVWADRLTFVRHAMSSMQPIAFEGIQDGYEPYSQIKLNINAQRSGNISLAVHDKALSEPTNDDGSLLTELLLSSQIKGFVEQPGYYFEKDDERHRRHLELLMMVQGWRRFQWHGLTHTFEQKQPMEKYRLLTGGVYNMDILPKHPYDPARIDHGHWISISESIQASQMGSPEDPNPKGAYYPSNFGSGPVTIDGSRHYFLHDPYSMEDASDDFNEKDYFAQNTIRTDQEELRKKSRLGREALVHAEFIQTGTDLVVGEMMTEQGEFTIPLPESNAPYLMHLAASDSTRWEKRFKKHKKWAKHDKYPWIVLDTETNLRNMPEFLVRLYFPYPRFVKPYNFYQTCEAEIRDGNDKRGEYRQDSTIYMREVTTRVRRGGLRGFDRTSPAFKLDSNKAFNAVVDAGMHPPVLYWTRNFMLAIAANYIGEMGIKNRSYTMEERWNYYNDSHPLDSWSVFLYRQLSHLDSVYVFTDYSPRKEGDKRYRQSNQPQVTVDLHILPNGGTRVAYRGRYLTIPGYNVCEDFYQPQYDKRPLPDVPHDYRRTLYWNPDLKLDEEGRATVTFWNNCRRNQLSITAEGFSNDGKVMTGRESLR